MQRSAELTKFGSRGFSLIDFLIIGAVISILLFIVVSNIIAHTY